MLLPEKDFISYPMRPINGGKLDLAPPKHGNWVAQAKPNEWRMLIHLPSGTIWNRHGKYLSVAKEFAVALKKLQALLPNAIWLDAGGFLRRHKIGVGTIIVLDVMDQPDMGIQERRETLNHLPILPIDDVKNIKPDEVYLIPQVSWDKSMELYKTLEQTMKASGCPIFEGIVAKSLDHPKYTLQRVSPDRDSWTWVKHRFLK